MVSMGSETSKNETSMEVFETLTNNKTDRDRLSSYNAPVGSAETNEISFDTSNNVILRKVATGNTGMFMSYASNGNDNYLSFSKVNRNSNREVEQLLANEDWNLCEGLLNIYLKGSKPSKI